MATGMREAFTSNGLHVRIRDGEGGPLICLPPAPHSSLYFDPLFDALGDHPVIGISYPGYGGSRRLSDEPSIDAYADAIDVALKDVHAGTVDLLGFHTGCLVAIALADRLGSRLRHNVLIDVPFFDAETRAAYAAKLPPDALPLPIEENFEKAVSNRPDGQSEDRAFRLWVERLRAGKQVNDAFRAAFAFDCEVRFAALSSSVDILATQSALLTPSRRAAETLLHATFTEIASVSVPVFDAHASRMAQAILTIIKPKGGPRHKVAP